jgi:LPXTG-motif cell wall-anchored protein
MRALELIGAVVATACLVGGGLVLASSASASAAPGADAAGRLLLSTDPDPLGVQDLPPGGEVDWQVLAALDAATGSELDLRVEATGPMTTSAAGMRLSVSRCSVAWSSLSCPAGDAASVLDTTPIVDVAGGAASHVTHLSRTGSTHLLVRITLPASAGNAFVGTEATVRLVLTAAGDVGTVGTGPDPTAGSLAATGVSAAGPALLGVGILAAGVVVASRRRRRAEAVLA